MSSSRSGESRGRGIRSGLVVFLAVISLGAISACQQGPPPGEPVEGYQEPSISQQNGWTLVENTDPAENLLIYDNPPESGVQLLFLGGWAASMGGWAAAPGGSRDVAQPAIASRPPTTWEPGALAAARNLLDYHLAPVTAGTVFFSCATAGDAEIASQCGRTSSAWITSDRRRPSTRLVLDMENAFW